jgi:hypothetical protein
VLIGDVFNGTLRYLGVTVDDGSTAVDNEISPRQQIVSTAFAFRAKYAEMLGTATGGNSLTVGDNGNVGIGAGSFSTLPARLTLTGSSVGTGSPQLVLTDSVDTTERLQIGIDSTGSGTGFIQANKVGTGAQNLSLNANGGNVGIGTNFPAAKLSITSGVTENWKTSGTSQPGAQLRLVGSPNGALDIGTAVNGGGWLQCTDQGNLANAYTLFLNPNGGNVGINSGNPTANLTIRTGKNGWPNTSGVASAPSATGFRLFGLDNAMLDAGVNSGLGAWLQATDQTNMATPYPLILNPNGGQVGIGTTSPYHALTVGGNPGDIQFVNIRSFTTDTLNSWKGAGAFGGSNATVIMGESGGVAQIGGHSPTLNAWKDLTINGGGGNVGIGIGTAAPTAKLDVAGDIKANGKSVPVAEENLRIIRGNVGSSGVRDAGAGFSVVRESAGRYKITYDVAFSSAPSVSAIPYTDLSAALPFSPPLESLTVTFSVRNVGYYDTGFSFIVMGPR